MIRSELAPPLDSLMVNRQPNVIILVTDDQGVRGVGCYSAKDIQAPNLDALAARGVGSLSTTRYHLLPPPPGGIFKRGLCDHPVGKWHLGYVPEEYRAQGARYSSANLRI
jgi:hypothetical protein